MQPAFPFVDISTPVDLLGTMLTPENPGGAGSRFQDRQDVHHHPLGHHPFTVLIALKGTASLGDFGEATFSARRK